MAKATWHTPIAALKNKEEVWQRIEDGGWKPRELGVKEEITYFNNNFKYQRLPEYDLYFAYTKTFPLWDERKNKDNRSYLPDIHENIFQQEKNKPVPVLTSMNYGRPFSSIHDSSDIAFRRQCATTDFYRKQGVMRVKERMAV